MEAKINLERISALRKFWEDNREVLKSLDEIQFGDDKTAELREKEKKFRDQQRDITHDWKVLKICVAGDFSAGKSTFINSLLDAELLGMDINPSTAKVTALTYGPEQRFFKFGQKNLERIEISKEEFAAYSVKNGLINDQDDIHHFEVTLPNDLLKKINIYDTPGYNTAEFSDVDEKQTEEQISKSDLVIWLSICSCGSIKGTEIEKLKKLHVPFHCIVNHIDDEPKEKVDKVLNEFRDQIKKINGESKVFPYAAKPILEVSLRLTEANRLLMETFEKILENVKKNNNGLEMEIKNGVVSLNGRKEFELPYQPEGTDFSVYKREFQRYLEDCILDKEERRKIAQMRLDRTTEEYCVKLMSDLNKAVKTANERIQTTKGEITRIRKDHVQELRTIQKRINLIYDNLKEILVGDLKENKFYLYHYSNGLAYSGSDYEELNNFVNQSVERFAQSLIESFKEEYSLDIDLKDWKTLFCNSIASIIDPTIDSIPNGMRMKGINFRELVKFEQQQVDNLIPDELFFSLLNLHSRNISYQYLQREIDVLNKRVESLEEFKLSASELLRKLKSKKQLSPDLVPGDSLSRTGATPDKPNLVKEAGKGCCRSNIKEDN